MARAPTFWKPGTAVPPQQGVGLNLERVSEDSEGAGTCITYNSNLSLSISQQKQRLPIFQHRNEILYLLERYRTLVIVGETGSGKTTQIPQYLHEAGWTANDYVVGITQPRRVAVTTVAARVAEERGTMLGREVGYSIRFDDCSDKNSTRIKFLTDGMLVREIMKDPLLSNYSVIMLDEAHERTLYTDIITGLLKKVQKKREGLNIIISSATLDAELFKRFFETNTSGDKSKDTATILSIEGRLFDVDIHYVKSPVPDYVRVTIDTIAVIHKQEAHGDVLAFLTGQEEVETICTRLREYADRINKKQQLLVLPLYGGLPPREQLKVFHRTPPNTRKVVVATNLAETSVTIAGIVYVIDCGFVKLRTFSAKNSIESLVVVPISQSSANQRSGRAGRLRSGKAYRLYTEEAYNSLEKSTPPEIRRSNLASVILHLKALGIDNVLRFSFITPPSAAAMMRGLELLYALEAIDDNCQLTPLLGRQIAEFPLHPMFAKMLLVSDQFGCSEEILSIAAMLQVQNVFILPTRRKADAATAHRKLSVYEGDHLTLLNVYRSFVNSNKTPQFCQKYYLSYKALMHADSIREQLKKLLRRFNVRMISSEENPLPVQMCIAAGFFANAACLHYTGEYKSIRGDFSLMIHPSSVLFKEAPPQWVVYNEVVQTSTMYMRDITVIKPDWLHQLAPHFYDFGTVSGSM